MKLITVGQAAEKLGISVSYVWKLHRTDPDFPRTVRLGPRATRWRDDEIDAWIEQQQRGEFYEN